MTSRSEIIHLVDSEIEKVDDVARQNVLKALLVAPQPLSLGWGYGKPGDHFECWLVGLSPDGRERLLYCEQGFGPTYPWGFVKADADWMGMDCQWHAGLEHAAIGASLLSAPSGYEVP